MDLLQFHHADGRPVTFERTTVLLLEPHSSGAGTLVRLGPADSVRELHLGENYDEVRSLVMASAMQRAIRGFVSEHEDDKVPF